MPINVNLPQWGMGMTDATIIKWLKKEGDPVLKGDHLVEVESSKVNAEIESPANGTLASIKYGDGDVVKVGEVVAVILEKGEKLISTTEPSPDLNEKSKEPSIEKRIATPNTINIQVTPKARKLAKDLNVDITDVAGSGPNGRIVDKDILDYKPNKINNSQDSPLTGIRKVISRRMSDSNDIPTVTLVSKVDLNNAADFQAVLLKEGRKEKLRPTLQDMIIKITSDSLIEHPVMNSHFINNSIKTSEDINIGIAYVSKKGLVVPVIKKVNEKSIIDVSKSIKEFGQKDKIGFSAEDFSEGTFSITSLQSSVVDYFNPLINPPQVGILGIGRSSEELFLEDGEVKKKKICYLSLSFDHRIIDGFPAAKFLESIVKRLENPSTIG
ncbi:dihydrolipoamide acetyltransferase family protein [Dehalococcoidia bacterium]|nr:dihydrolipoamide acetyltransferase family protein [Dehalococcoidia bacterium]